MASRQELNSGVGEIRAGLGFDEGRLGEWMTANVDGFRGPLTVRQFNGGQSNPTYRLETPGQTYVLRRKPPGQLLKSAHAVDREYKVITALHAAGFPAPRTFGLCTDDSVIGTWFYVMDCVAGRIIWDTTFPDVPRAERAAYFDAMNATIAQLHMFDPAAIGLGDFGKPGNYFARQIGRWSQQYLDDTDAGRFPAMDRLVEWLPAHIPPGDEVSVVHGDYRCDNMIFHPTEPRVLAVLDWELSTLGHPLVDLAYHGMAWRVTPTEFRGLKGHDLAALGIPSEAAYLADYSGRTGRAELPHWDYYLAFNMFRMAAILQGILARSRQGSAASAHAERTGQQARPMAEAGWHQVQLIQAGSTA